MINQVYIPYWKWEEWINGMYGNVAKDEEEILLSKSLVIMKDSILFGSYMQQVVSEWTNTMINNLTNPSINKKAFLGQCAICFAIKAPDYITKKAWKQLTRDEMDAANEEAKLCVNKWIIDYEEKNRRLHKNMGVQMLLRWNT